MPDGGMVFTFWEVKLSQVLIEVERVFNIVMALWAIVQFPWEAGKFPHFPYIA